MCDIKRDFEEKTTKYVTCDTPANPGLFRNSFDPPYFVPLYYQFSISNQYTQTIMIEFTFPVHHYFEQIMYCSLRFTTCNSLSRMTLMAPHLFVRLLRTNQLTCFFMMAQYTHETQSNITNGTTPAQMWICWRKCKIAWDYEVQVHVVIYRHHTCREHHSAQLWCFLNKF